MRAPATLSVTTLDGDEAVFNVDVKASSLFYDDEADSGELLWVGEFHKPPKQAGSSVKGRKKLQGEHARASGPLRKLVGGNSMHGCTRRQEACDKGHQRQEGKKYGPEACWVKQWGNWQATQAVDEARS